jgi:hypothetical protein
MVPCWRLNRHAQHHSRWASHPQAGMSGRWGASPPGLVSLTSQLERGRRGCRAMVSGSA